MLVRTHQLDTQQLCDLDALCADCKNNDANHVAIYKHLLTQNRPLPCNLLFYEEKKLTGFLSTFFFYDDACEIAMMVAPASRKQGIATRMIQEALPLIPTAHIKTLIFSTPHDLNNAWLIANGFSYRNSEYQMQRQLNELMKTTNNELIVRLATDTDLPALCKIDSACFSMPQPDMAARFHKLLHDMNYRLFIAQKTGVTIGKAHLHWQHDSVRLTDIAILPKYQGKGLGSAMLTYCINYCLEGNKSTIKLDVETTNQHALELYQRLGFTVKNAYDFWSIPIDAYLK